MDRLPNIPKQNKQIKCIVENKGKSKAIIARIETDNVTETTKLEIGNTSIKVKTKALKRLL